jgi:hypothetical protein
MIPFVLGAALIVFSVLLGGYQYSQQSARYDELAAALREAESQRDTGRTLQQRIGTVRRTTVVATDAQKFTLERLLDIGAPGLEWRFVGQARTFGAQRELARYTFRISGPASFAETQLLLERMNRLPGMVVYRVCYACTPPPRGTPEDLKMAQVEGYLYAYDPNTLY